MTSDARHPRRSLGLILACPRRGARACQLSTPKQHTLKRGDFPLGVTVLAASNNILKDTSIETGSEVALKRFKVGLARDQVLVYHQEPVGFGNGTSKSDVNRPHV